MQQMRITITFVAVIWLLTVSVGAQWLYRSDAVGAEASVRSPAAELQYGCNASVGTEWILLQNHSYTFGSATRRTASATYSIVGATSGSVTWNVSGGPVGGPDYWMAETVNGARERALVDALARGSSVSINLEGEAFTFSLRGSADAIRSARSQCGI